MKLKDLTEPEICGLQATLPDIIKNAAPLPANTLKKLLTIIDDEQKSRRERAKFGDWVKSSAEQIKEEHHADKDNTITIPVKADLDDTYWDAYKAELASKIAVAYAEKGRFAPDEIGEFAVRVANDVVDNLKKHEV